MATLGAGIPSAPLVSCSRLALSGQSWLAGGARRRLCCAICLSSRHVGGVRRFHAHAPGNIPTYTRVAAWVLQIGQAVLVPIFLYRVVVRPWRRDRNLSTDGVICLAMLTTWWADTLCNSLADFTNNSAAFINFGSWDRRHPRLGSRTATWLSSHHLGRQGSCICGQT